MTRIVILGGTGDVYLISALYAAFCHHHHQTRDVTLVLREKFRSIVDMFPGVPYECSEEQVWRGENDPTFQAEYLNPLLSSTEPFYVHPCMLRSQTRVDHLTTKPDASQADMYRMILRLPPEVPLTLPTDIPRPPIEAQSVLLIRDAVSWPNTQPWFWDKLADRLRLDGRNVIENDKSLRLGTLLNLCASSDWVIGPQCGVMSILCTGQFPCRKTLATPSVDDDRAPGFLAAETYPYAYVTKFDGKDYDVEEFKIARGNHADLVQAIATGQNAQRLWPHDPRPVQTMMAPITPGDALDRLAVLMVKRDHFEPRRRAAIEREYQRYLELCRRLRLDTKIEGMLWRLYESHRRAYHVLEQIVPAAMKDDPDLGGGDVALHVAAIRENRTRTDLKREIDAMVHAPYREVKSYYNEADTI